jgi:transglutaminase superfamily protein
MTRYVLPPSVYVCFTQDGAVFLDVRRDRYVGLELDKARTLRRVLAAQSSAETDCLARELVAAKLLSATANETTKPVTTPVIDYPNTLLAVSDEPPEITWVHIARFGIACMSVWLNLHVGSLEYAIRRLQDRKKSLGRSSQETDDVQSLVSIFARLRTFVYTARDHCLYDSFVMADYLRRWGVASTCVFGVRTLPFGAHCWVQIGGALVSEATSVEYVATYSPILTI